MSIIPNVDIPNETKGDFRIIKKYVKPLYQFPKHGRCVPDGEYTFLYRGSKLMMSDTPDEKQGIQRSKYMLKKIWDKVKGWFCLCSDIPTMTDIGLCELELIAHYDGGVYWFMDYRLKDDSGGVFLNSQIYKNDKDAIFALIAGTIKWTECHTEK